MAFSGKKYYKVKIENMIELLEKLKVGEKTFNLLRSTDAASTYKKNDDGSVQYIVTKGDEEVLNLKIEDNKEIEFADPDGLPVKALSTIDGDVVKTRLKLSEGREVDLDRYFDGNSMRMEVLVPGSNMKGVVYYEAAA